MKKFNGTPNLNGRPKGAVNKTTAEAKALLQIIVSNELETIAERLEQLDNKERIEAVIKLLPYIVPRQTEIAVESKMNYTPVTITLLENGNND
jgi:23S rRNA C2498 (ribose-2'-O)-methylase RlmM